MDKIHMNVGVRRNSDYDLTKQIIEACLATSIPESALHVTYFISPLEIGFDLETDEKRSAVAKDVAQVLRSRMPGISINCVIACLKQGGTVMHTVERRLIPPRSFTSF